MTPTHLNHYYGILVINGRWQGAIDFELQYELVRGIPNPASITKRHTWMSCGTWSGLQ